MKRAQNTGSIGLGKGGRHRVRVTLADGRRESFGSYATPEEAEDVLSGVMTRLAAGTASVGDVPTLLSYEARFFAMRTKRSRSAHAVRTDRSRWGLYLATAPFAAEPLANLTARDVQRWVDALAETEASDERGDRLLSRQTIKHCLNLLRAAFKYAMRDELVADHPIRNIELPPENRTEDPWDYLRPSEQKALLTCEAIPRPFRLAIAFALFTGMRRGEQWALQLGDLHTEGSNPHVVVRFGSPGKATKTNRIRRIPLIADGLGAAREWLDLLPSFAPKNPHRLVFPTQRGAYRDGLDLPRVMLNGVQPTEHETWRSYLAAAGIARPFRWYDLRHSFASSLVSGFWGRRWRLEEVRELLGHTSIAMTQRYAHLADSTLREAADGTAGLPGLAAQLAAHVSESSARHRGFEPLTFGFGGRTSSREVAVLPREGGHGLAIRALEAIRAGAPEAHDRAIALARAVLVTPMTQLARDVVDGDPTWAAKATRLAEMVLDTEDASPLEGEQLRGRAG